MKILILRFSSIGDIVLITPVLRAIHQQRPDIEVHVATKPQFKTILEHHPAIHQFHFLASTDQALIGELKQQQFDCIIDLHHNIRTLRIKRALGIPAFSFPKLNFKKWILTTFKINKMPTVHVVDRYFEAVKPLGIVNDQNTCSLFLDDQSKVDLNAFDLVSKQYIAVAMGAQFATKQIPLSILAKSLTVATVPIALLGGKEDSERAMWLKNELKSNKTIDFCGKLSLMQSAFLTQHAKVLLTSDTGLMHIASSFQTPIISIWGNTVPAFGMYPYAPNHPEMYSIYEVKELSCRPCSKIGFSSCPKKHFKCMNLQDVEAIQLDIQTRLNQ